MVAGAPAAAPVPETPPAATDKPPAREVAAFVNGVPVYVAEVDREMKQALGDRPMEPAAQAVLRARTLAQLIDRQLVLEYLEEKKLGASAEDVDLAVERIEKRLAARKESLAAQLEKKGMDRASFRRTLAWQLGWQRYLERYLTDENLDKYFQSRRRDFDGTQVHAAHILLKVDPAGGRDALRAAVARADEIRKEIAAGKLSFAEAAKKYSAAPTADRGGDVGYISRRESMPESFSRAAFELKPGEVSRPVVSPFGVHLIQCLDVKAGEKTWREVRGELAKAATRFLFRRIADRRRPDATIRFTGATPHFKPGTNQLTDAAP